MQIAGGEHGDVPDVPGSRYDAHHPIARTQRLRGQSQRHADDAQEVLRSADETAIVHGVAKQRGRRQLGLDDRTSDLTHEPLEKRRLRSVSSVAAAAQRVLGPLQKALRAVDILERRFICFGVLLVGIEAFAVIGVHG